MKSWPCSTCVQWKTLQLAMMCNGKCSHQHIFLAAPRVPLGMVSSKQHNIARERANTSLYTLHLVWGFMHVARPVTTHVAGNAGKLPLQST
eukprot:1893767-Amphidinium_carterae.1